MSCGQVPLWWHQGLPRSLHESDEHPSQRVSLTGSISGLSGEAGYLDSEMRVLSLPLVTSALQPEAMFPSPSPSGSQMVALCRNLGSLPLAQSLRSSCPQRPAALLLWQS